MIEKCNFYKKRHHILSIFMILIYSNSFSQTDSLSLEKNIISKTVLENNIQDYILNTARKDKIDLTIYLLNGVPLKGKVYSFDNFTIIIFYQI